MSTNRNQDNNMGSAPLTPGSEKRKKSKTKFPMARIKKIMQSDEEVGKIASGAPVLISKCLELFLTDLINNCVGITRARQAKTMSAPHLKECITSSEKYDFLKEIVMNVSDTATQTFTEEKPTRKRGRAKKEAEDGHKTLKAPKVPRAKVAKLDTPDNGEPKKKRGRPRKNPVAASAQNSAQQNSVSAPTNPQAAQTFVFQQLPQQPGKGSLSMADDDSDEDSEISDSESLNTGNSSSHNNTLISPSNGMGMFRLNTPNGTNQMSSNFSLVNNPPFANLQTFNNLNHNTQQQLQQQLQLQQHHHMHHQQLQLQSIQQQHHHQQNFALMANMRSNTQNANNLSDVAQQNSNPNSTPNPIFNLGNKINLLSGTITPKERQPFPLPPLNPPSSGTTSSCNTKSNAEEDFDA